MRLKSKLLYKIEVLPILDGDIEISFSPLNGLISFENEPYVMSEIDARDSDDVTLTFTISSDASPGSSSGIIINLN